MSDFFAIEPSIDDVFFGDVVPENAFFIELGAAAGVVPTVTYVSPTPSSSINPTDPIIVDVTDPDSANPPTFLFALFADGMQEVIWDGTAFAVYYGTSTRVAIANGFRYTIRRTNGWPTGAILIKANALDETGGIAA